MRTIVRNSYTPKTREYCNTIVVDKDNDVQYIFDSDGVWTKYTSEIQQGATTSYVNSAIASASSTLKNYADAGDTNTLAAAIAYTDAHTTAGAATQAYVDQQDASILAQAKTYADNMDVVTLQQANALISTATGSVTTNLEGEITALQNALSNVAFSGQFGDLLGKPDVPVITMTDVDPGEGVPLAPNHFIAVYVDSQESE